MGGSVYDADKAASLDSLCRGLCVYVSAGKVTVLHVFPARSRMQPRGMSLPMLPCTVHVYSRSINVKTTAGSFRIIQTEQSQSLNVSQGPISQQLLFRELFV